MKPGISLIIPVYNVERWLGECLNSVVNQSVPVQEVILINDGSTDHSLDICNEYCRKYSYFVLIDQENRGLSAARNAGMKYASGEYIMFLDSDDWLRFDTVEVLGGYLLNNRPDVIYFDADTVIEAGVEYDACCSYDRSGAGIDGEVMSGKEYFERTYPKYYRTSACLGLFRKTVIEKQNICFPEEIYYEDHYFTFLLLNKVKSVIHVSERLYRRRYRTNSIMTGKYTLKKFIDYIKVTNLIWNYIIEKNGSGRAVRTYVNDQCEAILRQYIFCIEQNIHLEVEGKYLLQNTLDRYFQLLDELEKLELEKEIEGEFKVFERLVLIEKRQLNKDNSIKRWRMKIEKQLIELYREFLSRVPLDNPNLKIGIYGKGKHTEGFLALYERLFGEIKCEMVFIDTYADGTLYKGSRVINYKSIDDSIQLVIVSSFLYRKQLLRNVREIHQTVPVLYFYQAIETDIFSIFSEPITMQENV